jgi:hypothetical protein
MSDGTVIPLGGEHGNYIKYHNMYGPKGNLIYPRMSPHVVKFWYLESLRRNG